MRSLFFFLEIHETLLTMCIYSGISVYIKYIQYIKSNEERGMRMDIMISNSSGKPIYEQITGQIKNLIMTGELKAGDPLPSMRLLAKELRISVITTKRAYEDLERDGFITTMVGRGSFVSESNTEIMKEEQLRIVEGHLTKAVEVASRSGVGLQEMVDILKMLYEEEE